MKALILRGIFLCRRHELIWFYQGKQLSIFDLSLALQIYIYIYPISLAIRGCELPLPRYVGELPQAHSAGWATRSDVRVLSVENQKREEKESEPRREEREKQKKMNKSSKSKENENFLVRVHIKKNWHTMTKVFFFFFSQSRLTSSDETVKLEAGRAWSTWEMATSRL